MRVLHVIPSVSPRRGGPSAAIFPMVAALRVRGIEVEIATTDEDFEESANVTGQAAAFHHGVPVRFFTRWRVPLRPLREFSYSPAFTSWLEKNIHHYDLLHVHALFSHLPTTAMRLARRHQIPYLSRPLGQLGLWPLRQSRVRKKTYLRLIEARNLRGASSLHFTSDSEQREAGVAGFSGESVVIPHGIDLPEIIPRARDRLRAMLRLAPDRRIILFLGRIHRKKGIDLLVSALARMAGPRPLLLLAGEGPHRSEIKRLITRLGLTSSVRWVGQISGELKQLCLQGADLFALVSHHENLGLAVLEALAAGTPVLVSREVALAGQIADNRLGTIVSLEVDAVSSALSQALAATPDTERERKRSHLGTAYSWPANATNLSELYQNIIERSRSPKWDRTA